MMMRPGTALCGAALLAIGCGDSTTSADPPLPPCEWCGAQDAPDDSELDSVMRIAGPDEPGDRMILRGRVFMPDAKTPAPNVLVYAYHTDATGVYRRDGTETGNGRRHGQLRGWLRTDEHGRYEIRSIKPAPYPGRTDPAHVHVTLTPPGGEEHWVDSFHFEGDPLISEEERARTRDLGRFDRVVDLEPNGEGWLVGERDLRLRSHP